MLWRAIRLVLYNKLVLIHLHHSVFLTIIPSLFLVVLYSISIFLCSSLFINIGFPGFPHHPNLPIPSTITASLMIPLMTSESVIPEALSSAISASFAARNHLMASPSLVLSPPLSAPLTAWVSSVIVIRYQSQVIKCLSLVVVIFIIL